MFVGNSTIMSRTTTETALIPEVEIRPRMSLLRPEVIEDAVIVSEEGRHPNFIEANTSGITLKELTEKNIIPTFSDNSLTLIPGSPVELEFTPKRKTSAAELRKALTVNSLRKTYN